MSCTFAEIPKPETADYYWKHVYPIWFYDEEKDNPDKARKPGVFKREFHVKNGSYVGLSSKVGIVSIIIHLMLLKCYSILDRDSQNQKKATKGITQRTPLEHQGFVEVLYGDSEKRTVQPRFTFCKKTNTMKCITQSKISLNPNLTKRFVMSDRVQTRPLKRDGKYI